MDVFTVNKFTFAYPGSGRAALDNISLSVVRGEFVSLCGRSGSGKTTLLRNLKPPLAPAGGMMGDILFYGRPLGSVGFREQAQRIGYVGQDPDKQIVAGTVWEEMAFGLENLGYDSDLIRLRIAEMASFFGIHSWFRKDIASLSGGQKQMLSLAAVMAVQPSVLILDEPTAQLDPVTATDFLETLKRINRDIGLTVIISEHRLEEVFPMSDRAIVLDKGKVIADAHPKRVGVSLAQYGHEMFVSMPTAMQVFTAVETGAEMRARAADRPAPPRPGFPITVREGREWLSSVFQNQNLAKRHIERATDGTANHTAGGNAAGPAGAGHTAGATATAGAGATEGAGGADTGLAPNPNGHSKRRGKTKFLVNAAPAGPQEPKAAILKDVWFRYGHNGDDVIRDFTLEIPSGKLMCIVGGNGAGKSTILKLLCGLLRPQRGKITVKGLGSGGFPAGSKRLAHVFGMLPQNPQLLFSRTTVSQDLADVFRAPVPGVPAPSGIGAGIRQYLPGIARPGRLPAGFRRIRIDSVANLLEIDGLLARNPYDLSGGELQRAALAKILLADPDILLLDEPTMGMDNHFKEKFSVVLRALIDKGKTVVMVSHDVEFCAKHADLCALLFDGGIAAVNEPGAFFSGNGYYTTAASRMSRHIFENAVTAKEVIALCRENLLI